MAQKQITEHERVKAIRLAKEILLLEEQTQFDGIWYHTAHQFRNIVATHDGLYILPNNQRLGILKDGLFHHVVREWAKL